MAFKGKIKKWGNSYGILITKTEMKKKKLHENQDVLVHIKKQPQIAELFGIAEFKKTTEQLMKEIKEGYDD
ncbi:hypothetical protein CMO92_01300 [Candidatus Woesearchaeota archaeon]|nr:hypothetical protein [Candidatus Woesearchaeota archaeon]|tara:strand:- start:74 stop:286 length:213 start_codon:yes stop_codon:yes gene_type:complete